MVYRELSLPDLLLVRHIHHYGEKFMHLAEVFAIIQELGTDTFMIVYKYAVYHV